MNILITAGPTREFFDPVRFLSNFSTGELGSYLALKMKKNGHAVTFFRSTGATADITNLMKSVDKIYHFTSTTDLQNLFHNLALERNIEVIFHLAAVSDFFCPSPSIEKIKTAHGAFTLSLKPTQKILPTLRGIFPLSIIVGWKFETGNRIDALQVSYQQISQSNVDFTVLNGSAYGVGFGIINNHYELFHCENRDALSDWFIKFLK